MIALDLLLDRCRGGDPLAWEELVRRLQTRIQGIALFHLRDREEARDAAQEIFVKLYQHLGEMRDARTFLPWLHRMARNLCIDRLRAQGARGAGRPAHEELAAALPDGRPTPEETAIRDANRTMLYRALETLSDVNREIVVLKDIRQLRLEEIGSILKLPLGTIKSRSNRARAELAKAVRTLEATVEAAP